MLFALNSKKLQHAFCPGITIAVVAKLVTEGPWEGSNFKIITFSFIFIQIRSNICEWDPILMINMHSWAKFKIVLVRKPGRKFYYFMAKFQGSGFSFPSLNQNIKVVVFPSNFWFQKFKVVVFPSNFWFQNFKVVVFPSNFWKTTIIWQFLEWFWIFLRNVITSKIKSE